MDDVGVETIISRGHGRKSKLKIARADWLRMQVKDDIHGRPAQHVEMHEVVVVGNEVVELALLDPARIGELEVEDVAGLEARLHLKRLINVAGVVCGA